MRKHDQNSNPVGTIHHGREYLEGYLFIAPAVILVGLFGIFPLLFTIYVSLFKWRIKRGPFLLFDNYVEIFGSGLNIALIVAGVVILLVGFKLMARWRHRRKTKIPGSGIGGRPAAGRGFVSMAAMLVILLGAAVLVVFVPKIYAEGDDGMLDSFRVTIWYSLGAVPVQLIMGLIVAVLLDRKFKGKQFFRVVFLLPYIVPSVAAAAVFERLFSLRPESFANQILLAVGAEPQQWLQEPQGILTMLFGFGAGKVGSPFLQYWRTWAQGPSLALVSIMFFNYWVFVGYYALIYSNGLAQIPRQMYEAAEIDGAGKLTIFFRIIIPMLSPTTFFLTMLGIIGTFKAFTHIYVLRSSAARGAVDPMSVYIFFTFFRKSRFGYAAALSLVLFLFVLGLTMIQRRLMESRVHYAD